MNQMNLNREKKKKINSHKCSVSKASILSSNAAEDVRPREGRPSEIEIGSGPAGSQKTSANAARASKGEGEGEGGRKGVKKRGGSEGGGGGSEGGAAGGNSSGHKVLSLSQRQTKKNP